MHPQATYELWKHYKDLDPELKKELLSLSDGEIKVRYHKQQKAFLCI